MIRALSEIPLDASTELFREQIAARKELLPRTTNPGNVRLLRREIAELEHRIERRG